MDLNDAKVLVTGGTSGIGLETARSLIGLGAKVAICGRNEERLKAAEEDLGCLAIHADVSNEADVIDMVTQVIKEFDGYNVLINNAAYAVIGPLVAQETEPFAKMFETNVVGAMMVTRESAKYFVEQNYGNILNVGSTAGDKGFAMGGAYSASKFALRGLTECWRAELRMSNIRVMLIKPSEVITNFAKTAGYPQEDSDRKLHAGEIAHAIVAALQMPDRGFIPELPIFATNPD